MTGKYDELSEELLFNDEFSLSDGEISEEEDKDTYCYRGEACLTKESVKDFKSSDSSGFSLDESEGKSKGATIEIL